MKKDKLLKMLKEQTLTVCTLSGVVLGVVVGLAVRGASSSKWTEREVMYIKFIGEIFLRMLKGLILPLVVSSLIAAIGSLNLRLSGQIGSRAILYYMITTVMAVILGIILVSTIRPGSDHGESRVVPLSSGQSSTYRKSTTADTMLDLVRNMFPPNIVQACIEQYQTVLVPPRGVSNSSKAFGRLHFVASKF